MVRAVRIAAVAASLIGAAAWLLLESPSPRGMDQAHRAKSKRLAPYFVGDPNVTGDLRPWQYFDSGGTFSVSRFPTGVTSPGVVGVANDPLGRLGRVYKETVTASSRWSGGAARGDWTYLYNAYSASFGRNGNTDWIHFRVMFPGGGAYRNTRGEWNVLEETHQNSAYLNWPLACEVGELTLTVIQYSGDRYPHLAFRVMGGDDACPLPASRWIYDKAHRLRYNHWYDVLIHVRWSPDSRTGLVEWWLDRKLRYSAHVADLWRRLDGTVDHPEFELNNYRLHSLWPSTVYYSRALLGRTRSSVAFG